MLQNFDFMAILFSLPAIFLALSWHEFAHAFVADRLGDPTPRNQGRLTLDPINHIDMIGLIMLVFAGFGWAKPVQVNTGNFKNPRIGDILVSLAGCTANFIMAFFALLILYVAIYKFKVNNQIFIQIVMPIVRINLMLMILNILPIPPLDGFHIFKNLINSKYQSILYQLDRYGFLILILLSFTGVLGFIINFLSGPIFNGMSAVLSLLR